MKIVQIKFQELMPIFLAFIAFLLYCLAIWRFSANFPYGDDYDAILNFLNQFPRLDFKDQILSILSQHNEHRIALNRITQLAFLNLSGQINFIQLIWIGNLGWLLVIWIIYAWAKNKKISFREFCPVIIILLSFSHYELMTFPMASIQQYYQVLFCVVGIYFMTSDRLTLALLFYVMAVFTGGGGLVLGPVMIMYYWFLRKWKVLLMCISTVALATSLYFSTWLEYSKSFQDPNALEIMKHPVLMGEFILGFLGSAGHINKLGLFSGIFFGIITLLLFLKKAIQISKNYAFLWWLGLYIIFVSVLTAMARGGFGVMYAQTTSRYTQYSLLIMAIVYLIYLLNPGTPKARKAIARIGMIFSVILFTYWFNPGSNNMKTQFNELNSRKIIYPDTSRAQEILRESSEKHIFN